MKVYGNGNWNRHIHRGRFNYVINFELCILDNTSYAVLAVKLIRIGIIFILVRKRNVM